MKDLIIYLHGKGGSAEEAEHYKILFPNHEVIGFDYKSQTPWEAKKEFFAFFAEQRNQCGHLTLVANSIGAFFALSSLDETLVDRAYFISPVVDMVNTHSVRLAIQNTVCHYNKPIYHLRQCKSPLVRTLILFFKSLIYFPSQGRLLRHILCRLYQNPKFSFFNYKKEYEVTIISAASSAAFLNVNVRSSSGNSEK